MEYVGRLQRVAAYIVVRCDNADMALGNLKCSTLVDGRDKHVLTLGIKKQL